MPWDPSRRTAADGSTSTPAHLEEGEEEEEDGEWEFVPARVPDGISLRNFGIQVVSVFFSFIEICAYNDHHDSQYMRLYLIS